MADAIWIYKFREKRIRGTVSGKQAFNKCLQKVVKQLIIYKK